MVCQIEDREAVDAIDTIAALKEVDCLFIDRADLAVSYDVWDINHPTNCFKPGVLNQELTCHLP